MRSYIALDFRQFKDAAGKAALDALTGRRRDGSGPSRHDAAS